MRNIYGKNIFVTGASSGIGLACAEEFASMGCTVTGVSRSCDETVKEFSGGGRIIFRKMDVTDTASTRRIINSCEKIDIAVLAAGMGVSGPAEEIPVELVRKQMETNYFGVLNVGSFILPKMHKAGHGLFLVIGSVAGRVPVPMQSSYSASKYALEAYTRSVDMEMRRYGVRACIIEPGDTRTGFTGAREKYMRPGSPYADICERSVSSMERDEQNGMSPDKTARTAVKLSGRKNPPPRVIVGNSYKALMFFEKILPDRVVRFGLTKLYL